MALKNLIISVVYVVNTDNYVINSVVYVNHTVDLIFPGVFISFPSRSFMFCFRDTTYFIF